MAIEKSFRVATDVEPLSAAYFRIAETNFNHVDKVGRIGVAIYRSKEAREAACQPVSGFGYEIAPEGTKEVVDQLGQVIRPAMPGFDELMGMLQIDVKEAATIDLYLALKALCYRLIAKQPELAGGKEV